MTRFKVLCLPSIISSCKVLWAMSSSYLSFGVVWGARQFSLVFLIYLPLIFKILCIPKLKMVISPCYCSSFSKRLLLLILILGDSAWVRGFQFFWSIVIRHICPSSRYNVLNVHVPNHQGSQICTQNLRQVLGGS